jgi:hypothetical protein
MTFNSVPPVLPGELLFRYRASMQSNTWLFGLRGADSRNQNNQEKCNE